MPGEERGGRQRRIQNVLSGHLPFHLLAECLDVSAEDCQDGSGIKKILFQVY